MTGRKWVEWGRRTAPAMERIMSRGPLCGQTVIVELSRIKTVFRFSLLTLFVAIAAVSVLMALAVKDVHDQRATIAWATETGGSARYDFEFDTQGFAIGHYDENNQWISDAVPPGPGWLRGAVGVDFFASVAGVSIRGKETSDLSRLRHVPSLQGLRIQIPASRTCRRWRS